jgi:alkanesulfonate monooxygenase SsuD/methylene tetrahydromethanopterin reductase-like flavin-dependent oxidoreductase (luciferase family)
VAVSEDKVEAQRVVRERVAFYPRLPFYAEMFAAAGYPEAHTGQWSERMLEAVVIAGDEAAVADGVAKFVATSGASELIASIVPVGKDELASTVRAMRLIASL